MDGKESRWPDSNAEETEVETGELILNIMICIPLLIKIADTNKIKDHLCEVPTSKKKSSLKVKTHLKVKLSKFFGV